MTTDEAIIYLAGLFDGEGSIAIGKAHKHRLSHRKTRYLQLQVHLGMQNRAGLELWIKTFGGNITTNASMVYRVATSGRKAGKILERLRPHLLVKRDQADLALLFQSGMNPPGCQGYPDSHFKRHEEIRLMMSGLNHRDGLNIRKVLKQQAS